MSLGGVNRSCAARPGREVGGFLARLGQRGQGFGNKSYRQIGVIECGPLDLGPVLAPPGGTPVCVLGNGWRAADCRLSLPLLKVKVEAVAHG